MSFNRTALAATMVTFSLASAGVADVTADDVWADFRAYMTGVGYSVEASQNRSGNTLTVENIRVATSFGPGEGSVETSLGSITLTENSNGTVDIAVPEVVPFTTEFDLDDGVRGKSVTEYRQEGAVITASGTPAAMRYDYAADAVSVVSDGLEIEGVETADEIYSMRFDMRDVTGFTNMILAATRDYDQTLQAGGMTYSIVFSDPEGDGEGRITGTMDDLVFTGRSAVPTIVTEALMQNMNALLGAGFAVEGTFKAGRNDVQIISNDPDAQFAGEATSTSATLDVSMNQDGLTYSASQAGVNVNFSAPSLPFPVVLSAADSGFDLAMPLRTSDTSGDFGLGFLLQDFTMDEAIWSIFDPGAQLPRDPATLLVELSGKAKVLFDFLDPGALAAAAPEAMVPAEIESANIDALRLDLAGAELTGTGAFTFDNSQSFGPPRPVGSVDLRLEGGNGLIDSLVAIGLLPEEQAMAARMMMGLLAIPGDTPDTMTSRIEINEQGHILANGQRIQ